MSRGANGSPVSKTAAKKMGVRPGANAYHHDVPEAVRSQMHLPTLAISESLHGHFEHIHAFMTTQQQMRNHLADLRDALAADGSLWLSWPKAGQLDTDLTLPEVIRIGYDTNLAESKCISIDATWSALKFTHPIEGKTYRNSHGQLPRTPDRRASFHSGAGAAAPVEATESQQA